MSPHVNNVSRKRKFQLGVLCRFCWTVLLSVHHVELVSLDMLVQGGVFGDPPHPGQDEALCEGFFAQRAPPFRCQHTVDELETETEAVVVIFVEPRRRTDR